MATHTATRLLRAHPGLARESIYAAIAADDLAEVERFLAQDAGAATRPGGPRDYEPLLYLANARLASPNAGANAVAIARLLLDRGADPNVSYSGGNETIRYTVLTGVMGDGEEHAAEHPRARELARLLFERGAKPYDVQVMYNTHFHGPPVWLLDLMVEFGRPGEGADPEWTMIDRGGYGRSATHVLQRAAQRDDAALIAWCLAHGADPSAVRAFVPELTPRGLHEAAQRNRADVIAMLLDSGVPLDGTGGKPGGNALHAAAYAGAAAAAQMLIDRGIEVDFRDGTYHNTPLGWAVHAGAQATIDIIGRHSRDVFNLVFTGNIERLRELLREEPALVHAKHRSGELPLMWLPDDEARAREIIELFLGHGADPKAKDKEGLTAADWAERRGMDELAALLSR